MKTVKVEFMMDVEDSFYEDMKRWEHHTEDILDLQSYPEINSVYDFKVIDD